MAKMYTYKDSATGDIKRTRGEFVGWTKPTGFRQVRDAIFKNHVEELFIPEDMLTEETKERIAEVV